MIRDSLTFAYLKMDTDFYENVYKEQLALKNKKIKNVGSCGLTLLIKDDKIFVANCGDS